MGYNEIEGKLQELVQEINKQEFIYDFLLIYGISKTSITRLKKGDYNLSKVEGEVLYKNKILFKEESTDKLLITLETISQEQRILKSKPRFAIVTDYKTIVAKDLKTKKNRDFPIKDLAKYFDFFLPLDGAEVYKAL